jgi:2-polyprenyl-3-methyl-5-hydroxy-6-metoxy-1,4-benzoquinol methylase
METKKKWHEDDSFWENWGPVLFTPQRIAAAEEEMEKVIALAGLAPGARVLDLCCGIGRCSLALARRGYRVTGVDRTAGYLEQAKKQAEEEKLDIEFIRDDMRNFTRPDSFDGIICMYTSWSYFEDPEEDRQVILNACSSLKPGGVFIIQTHGKETLAKYSRKREARSRAGRRSIVLEERER